MERVLSYPTEHEVVRFRGAARILGGEKLPNHAVCRRTVLDDRVQSRTCQCKYVVDYVFFGPVASSARLDEAVPPLDQILAVHVLEVLDLYRELGAGDRTNIAESLCAWHLQRIEVNQTSKGQVASFDRNEVAAELALARRLCGVVAVNPDG